MNNRLVPVVLVLVLGLSFLVASCTPSPPEEEPGPRVMLEVESCGWQPPVISNTNTDGKLVITENPDIQANPIEFFDIYSPDDSKVTTFNGRRILLERHDVTWPPASEEDAFISDEDDFNYLNNIVENLTFIPEKSERSELDARLVLTVYDEQEGAMQITQRFFICRDGVVLKKAGSEEIDGSKYGVYHESSAPVDYYQCSAIELKYSHFHRIFYWECFENCYGGTRQLNPENYRLCISSPSGHRDLTLDEAKELLPSIPAYETIAQLNRFSLGNANNYAKITEYTLQPNGEREEKTYYLSPEGKLISYRDFICSSYHNQEMECYHLSMVWEAKDTLDYSKFLNLLEPVE